MSTPALLPRLAPHLRFAGVDPRLLEEAHLRWTVESRCRELGIPDTTAYLKQLSDSPSEIVLLLESIVVGETRFFRDSSVFAGIKAWVPSLAAAFPGPLRILSAPCSTGQEPYSLAATLLDAGLPATRFTLDALDISENALRVARRGVYAESALRGLGERDRLALAHFHDDRWIIRDELKDRIHFLHRNLAAQDPLAGEKYHLILCRNLFIYLHAEARATLAATLADALHPGGRLVIGTADHVPELNAVFAPLQPASAFALIPLRDKPQPGRHKPVSGLLESAIPPHNTAPQPSLHDADLHHASAEELHRRALESQHVGNVRLAERRCRQALYVDPSYLPAMELLDTLWHSTASMRMRAALSARIHRMRRSETHSE